MLLACSRCHRQYDVGVYPAGSRVRCTCGELNTVPEPRSRQVAMLHCSNCGGKLESASSRCAYCSSEVELADRGLGPACPECFATTFARARHCHACGVAIAPEAVLRALASHACPRCRSTLSECEEAGTRHIACTGCGGVWLDDALFQRVAERHHDELAALIQSQPRLAATAIALEKSVRYLACPVCGELMNRRNFAECSGIILDSCRGHGWWFDAQELERVMAFLREGGLERSQRIQHEKRMQDLRRQEDRARNAAAPLPTGVPADARWDLFEALARLVAGLLRSL